MHLGVVKARPYSVLREPHWALIKAQMSEMLEGGWSVGEISELGKEARRFERLVREPKSLVEGRTPQSKRRDSARDLLASEDPARSAWHPRLQPRTVPTVTFQAGAIVRRSPGTLGKRVKTFTLGELAEYWAETVRHELDEQQIGALAWVVEQYGLCVTLHAIDRLARTVCDARDPRILARLTPFSLKPFAEAFEEDRQEAVQWL